MMQGPFLLCLCQRGAFTAFQMIFLFRCSFVPETERLSRVYACLMNETNGHTQSGKSVRMTVAAPRNKYRRSGNIHMTKSVGIIILNRFEPLHRLIYPYEILIGLPSNLIRFSALRVGTLINNRFIARLAAT